MGITPMMVEHLNLLLEKEGSCLRYMQSSITNGTACYELRVVDKYVSKKFNCVVNVSPEFDTKVRNFFEAYGVANIGFINTVNTIFVRDVELKLSFS